MSHFSRISESLDFWQNPNRNLWLRRVVVSAVLLLSVCFSFLSTQVSLLRILAVIMGLCGLFLLLNSPSLGLLAILVAGFFIPYTGPGGLNVAVLMVAFMGAIWVLNMIVKDRSISLAHRQTAIPILVFILASILSFIVGQMPWFNLAQSAPITAQIGGLSIFILSCLGFLLVANLVRDLKWLQALTWTFLAISILYISGRLYYPWGHFLRSFFQPGAVAGSVFWIWMLIIPFSQAVFNRTLPILARVGLMIFAGLVLYVGIFDAGDWKSGYVPPLAAVAVIIAILLKKRVLWFIPVGIALILYIVFRSIATEDYSWFTRQEAWEIVLKLAMVNPILGLGFANYYYYTPLIPINGWYVNFNSHSQYVDLIAQTGLVGITVYFWIFWAIGKLGWQLRKRAPAGFARAYVYGALGGLVGMLVAGGLVDWVLPFVYNIGLDGFRSSIIGWLFLGGLVAINQIVEGQENDKKKISVNGGLDG